MHAIAHALAIAAAAAFFLIGAFAVTLPVRLSRAYGLPATEPVARAFVRATGARDMALGVILFAAVLSGSAVLLRIIVASGCVVAIADFALAYGGAGRTLQPQHATHLAGAIGFALILFFLI